MVLLMVLLLIRAGADHSPDGGSGADGPAGHPPDGAGHPPDGSKQTEMGQADQMIRMVLVLVSLIKLTKLISNKLRC